MSWSESHSQSESFATEAQLAARRGDALSARELYARAAEAELEALRKIDKAKTRTLGVTAVSAAALWYKAGQFSEAESVAYQWLGSRDLPPFASDQLREILQEVWNIEALKASGVEFTGNEVLVSVSGGEVVHGGAPLDLVLQKVEQVSATFYRTAEMLLNLPHRKRGAPTPEVREACRPWLFQAAPGSYQFAVRVQKPRQATLFPGLTVEIESLSGCFLQIVRAAAEDPEEGLMHIVPNEQYRKTFLKLARQLAPAGKTYSRLSIRSAIQPETEPIVLEAGSRDLISSVLKKQSGLEGPAGKDKPVQFRGTLRALHLDHDWIEVTVKDSEGEKHVKIQDAGEEVDDILGPMVNREVIVEAVRTPRGKYGLRDIQPAE